MKSIKLILLFASVSSGFGENIFYEKLEKLAEHCLQHGGMVDSGTMLGVYFAKGQLLSEREKPDVRNLLGKLDLIEEKYLKNHEISDENEIGEKNIFNASLFTKSFPLRFGAISLNPETEFLSTNFYLATVNDDRNMPNGFYSDRCLSELTGGCQISEVCGKVENVASSSFGYSLTHKFLFHLFDHIVCHSDKFLLISTQICNQIYSEAVFISGKTSIVPELKDLLMEQIFLCSFAGFGEFLNNNWIASLITWQTDDGCFSYDNERCSSHMNGLGAASLALFGKTLSRM